jgi:glutamine---fructose-6-phosphate transaminase (isomerizing)
MAAASTNNRSACWGYRMPERMKEPMSIAGTATFPHAMLSEIYEQPQALAATIEHYVPGGASTAETFQPAVDALGRRERLVIAASGSSRHAGLAGEIMLEDLAGIPVDVEYASEYTYRSTHTLHNPGVLVISQSGETADTLAALHEAQARGLATVAITNNADSSMAKEANASLPTFAGIEKAIPATKSFTTQLAVLYSLALHLARFRGRMTQQAAEALGRQLREVPLLLQLALPGWQKRIEALAPELANSSTLLYLGRGAHYAIAREGALKLKESAYLNAEGYPAGELKHGPNALVSKDTPQQRVTVKFLSIAIPASSSRRAMTFCLLSSRLFLFNCSRTRWQSAAASTSTGHETWSRPSSRSESRPTAIASHRICSITN